MNEVLHADIFFVITSACVIIVTILLVVILVFGIRIFRNVSRISETVRHESEELADDMKVLREEIKERGSSVWNVVNIFRFITKQFNKFNKKSKRHDK